MCIVFFSRFFFKSEGVNETRENGKKQKKATVICHAVVGIYVNHVTMFFCDLAHRSFTTTVQNLYFLFYV